MKKIIAIILSLILCALPICVCGAGCSHNYEGENIDATCVSRGYTLYTCSMCGDSYRAYESLAVFPDTFYFVLEGERNGNKLTLYLRQDNNTGIWSTRATVKYNINALNPVSAEVGEVWEGTSESVTINREEGYLRHFTSTSDSVTNNYKNGIVFKAEFEILQPISEWNLSLSIRGMDIVNSDSEKQPFQIFNTVTMGYSDIHSYGEGVVTLEPTVTSEGEETFECDLCGNTKVDKLPMLPRFDAGDVDGNGKINQRDYFLIRRYIKGYYELSNQSYDAADVTGDGKVNALDIYKIKSAIKNGQIV